jgi:hypothetical protein
VDHLAEAKRNVFMLNNLDVIAVHLRGRMGSTPGGSRKEVRRICQNDEPCMPCTYTNLMGGVICPGGACVAAARILYRRCQGRTARKQSRVLGGRRLDTRRHALRSQSQHRGQDPKRAERSMQRDFNTATELPISGVWHI